MPCILAYNESSLPVPSQNAGFQLAVQGHFALEIANNGHFNLDPYLQANIPITAVQAYAMHEFHPLHPEAHHRYQALNHVQQTLEIAAQLQVPRIVTVCGFGTDVVDTPFERCLEFFSACAAKAKALGIKIMIEPLSPLRCGAMTDPNQIGQLVDTLAEPTVFTTLLDTGHLLDSGYNLDQFLPTWTYPLEELQLKGPNSAPPPCDFPLRRWLQQLPIPPAVVCIEHRQPITVSELHNLISAIRMVAL